jgi:glycosyltransferase involved in cell wall biosynthesis
MANGLGVVASVVGGIPDMIDRGCGVLVEPGDVDGLARSLRRVLDDFALRSALGAAALERVRQEFDIDAVWRQFDALYRELVG